MDSEGKYHAFWLSGGIDGSDYITFEVQVATKGWIGLGLSPSGSMAGADIVIVWIDNKGQAHITVILFIENCIFFKIYKLFIQGECVKSRYNINFQ